MRSALRSGCAAAVALVLESCTPAPSMPNATDEQIRSLLPSLLERACPSEGPRLERLDELGGYTLWLSTPTQADANRYLLDLAGSPCSLVVQSGPVTPVEPGGLREDPYLYWPSFLLIDYAPSYQPPPPLAADDPANLALDYINSEFLARQIASEMLVACQSSGAPPRESCQNETHTYFEENAVVLSIDVPGLSYPGGVSLDVLALEPHWEGESVP